jgi:hypothetical protein
MEALSYDSTALDLVTRLVMNGKRHAPGNLPPKKSLPVLTGYDAQK